MQALARAAERAAPPQWPASAVAPRSRVARASYSSGGAFSLRPHERAMARALAAAATAARRNPTAHPPPPPLTSPTQKHTGNDPSTSSPPQVGSRVEPWLSSPLGALAFGPRAALGALLTLPSRLGGLPADLQRAQELLADPRPLGDKQAAVAAEVEARLVAALEAGARVEQEALGSIVGALPADAARAVDELLLQPLRPPVNVNSGAYSPSSSSAAYSPDWMTSTEEGTGTGGAWSDGGSGGGAASSPWRPPPSRYEQMYGAANAARPAPTTTYTADAVAARQVASELAGVRAAVAGLKVALEGLRAGSGAADAGARQGVLRLNVREARDVLAARLEEIGPPPAVAQAQALGGGGDAATLAAAVREARLLLSEVDGQFGF